MASLEELTYDIVFYKDNVKYTHIPCNFLAPFPFPINYGAPVSEIELKKYKETKENYTHYAIEKQGVVLYKQEI